MLHGRRESEPPATPIWWIFDIPTLRADRSNVNCIRYMVLDSHHPSTFFPWFFDGVLLNRRLSQSPWPKSCSVRGMTNSLNSPTLSVRGKRFAPFALATWLLCSTACSVESRDGEGEDQTLAAASLVQPGAGAPTPDAIVHTFNVPFRTIEAELPGIESAGFGAIQISPPQLSNGGAWWGRYQPIDYRVIDGPLGDEADLRRLVQVASGRGLRVVADLVLNHMANLGPGFDLSYPPQWARQKYNVQPFFSAQDFHPPFCIRNYGNLDEARRGRICGGGGDTGLPDLNQESNYVISVQRDYIAKLNDIGIKGYRVDAVKHMTTQAMNRIFTPDLVGGKLVYGEVIATQNSFGNELEPYLRETRLSYQDFPLQERIRAAFGVSTRSRVSPCVPCRTV